MSGIDDDNQNVDEQNQVANEGDQHLSDEEKDEAALWDELAANEAAASGDTDDQSSADADDLDGAAAAAAADDDENADDAANRQGSDDAPGDNKAAQAADANKADKAADVWANATPEQKAAFEAAEADRKKLEQALRSDRGRLSALQRQINELTRKPAASAAGNTGASDGAEFLQSEDWKNFSTEYPEIAGPLGKVVASLQMQVATQSKVLNAIGDERQQAALNEQEQILASEHSDWLEVGTSQEFTDWVFTQPRHIQEAAFRNHEHIVDAAEAADLIGRYKQFAMPKENNAAANAGGGTQNNRSDAKRRHQLESASSVRGNGPGVASGIPEDGDEEAIWKMMDEQERRKQRA